MMTHSMEHSSPLTASNCPQDELCNSWEQPADTQQLATIGRSAEQLLSGEADKSQSSRHSYSDIRMLKCQMSARQTAEVKHSGHDTNVHIQVLYYSFIVSARHHTNLGTNIHQSWKAILSWYSMLS